MPCCKFGSHQGKWVFPDGGEVPRQSSGTTFYRNRGFNDGTVNLNRVNYDVMMPTGRFCCVVPDATNTDVTVCVNIGKLRRAIFQATELPQLAEDKFTCEP